jgi:hypothetical protein
VPVINATIKRAWWHRTAEDRIHYVVATTDGGERRLYADRADGLYPVLRAYLDAQGYTGPSED